MRKMKKISALLLAVCMGTGLLAGCSSGDTKKADTEKQRKQEKRLLYSGIPPLILKMKNLT